MSVLFVCVAVGDLVDDVLHFFDDLVVDFCLCHVGDDH